MAVVDYLSAVVALQLALPILVLVPKRAEPRVVDTSDAVRRALTHSQISLKEAAYRMGIEPSELSRMLNDRGCNLARLANLGPEFWAYLLPMLHDAFAVPSVAVDATLHGRIVRLETQLRDLWNRVAGRQEQAS